MFLSEKQLRQFRRKRRKPSGDPNGMAMGGAPPAAAHGAFLILQQLHRVDAFRGTQLSVDVDMFGSAIVHCCGIYQGAWHWDSRAFSWIPAGYGQPQHRVATPEEAAHHTICLAVKVVARRAQGEVRAPRIAAARGVTGAADNDNAIVAVVRVLEEPT